MLAGRSRFRSSEPASQLSALSLLWAAFAFALVASSATKFHHYIFPAVPPLAILIGLFADRLWEEGVAEHSGALVLGLVLFALPGKDLADKPRRFLDLFTSNYQRPYPSQLITPPVRL